MSSQLPQEQEVKQDVDKSRAERGELKEEEEEHSELMVELMVLKIIKNKLIFLAIVMLK